MAAPLLVGLDVGTTASKAVVFTDAGEPLAQASAPTPWTPTRTGAELDATALFGSAVAALAGALSAAPPGPVAGLGVASMGESGVLLDRSGEPSARSSPGTTPGTRRR
ncbi:hypothetical protein GCM10027615_38780 [Plantactinospora veratri]